MTPTERCHAEIVECLSITQLAYLATIWHTDWLAELWMIEREAS